jgi:hypothetical protein
VPSARNFSIISGFRTLRGLPSFLPLAWAFRIRAFTRSTPFIGGETKIALDNYWPQKWPATFADARETTGERAADLFVRLVDSALTKSFNGQFPFHRTTTRILLLRYWIASGSAFHVFEHSRDLF